MDISVILCTYNRSGSLAKALGSVAASHLPESVAWEVLVVDNNSNDRTHDVVEDFCNKYPGRFRYHLESRPGKSHALGAGIQAARGEILAFIDDDVTVEPTWLQNLTRELHDGEWVGAGGRILPERDFPRPRWLPTQDRYGLAPLAIFDLGPQSGELTEAPFGTNMAFQRKVFEKHGGFRTDLGPCPGRDIQHNEDIEFGDRLLAAGERLRYEPSAVVYHAIPPTRLTKEYFLAWWFDKTRADIRQFGLPSDSRWLVAGIPLYMFRRWAVWTMRWLVAVEPSRRFSNKIRSWTLVAQILESYQQRHCRSKNGLNATSTKLPVP